MRPFRQVEGFSDGSHFMDPRIHSAIGAEEIVRIPMSTLDGEITLAGD
jgi:hypothetical protein